MSAGALRSNVERTELILQRLLSDTLLGRCRHTALARILPHARIATFAAGDPIYRSGDTAERIHLLVTGEAELIAGNGRRVTRPAGCRIGEESGTDFAAYLSDARATSILTTIEVPRERVAELIRDNPELRGSLYSSLMQAFGGDGLDASDTTARPKKAKALDASQAIGWSLVATLPVLALAWALHAGLSGDAAVLLATFLAAVGMWIFRLVDEYVPGLFVLLIALCLDLAPTRTVLSGFASDGFFLAMSILGLGAVIVASGLSYRLLLVALARLPRGRVGPESAMMLIGGALTPILPTANGRVALLAPFLLDTVDLLGLRRGGPAATRLAAAAFSGCTLLSGVFLTSKSVNFVVFGMLAPQLQDQFQWLHWFVAALATGIVLLAAHILLIPLAIRGHEDVQVSRSLLRAQLRLLGGLKRREWAAIAGMGLFAIGVLTHAVHAIPAPWIALAILYALLLFGFLSKREFREQVDWTFLVYLASVVGIVRLFEHVGLAAHLSTMLAPISRLMQHDLILFLLALAGTTCLLRLVVPINAAVVLMAVVFMPLADQAGINQWLVGFAILMLGEMWFLPYQCSYYLQFRELAQGVYDEPGMLRLNAMLNVARIGGLIAAIPWWKAFGIA
jgi:divalent anion:Na+ symporter, DASS family